MWSAGRVFWSTANEIQIGLLLAEVHEVERGTPLWCIRMLSMKGTEMRCEIDILQQFLLSFSVSTYPYYIMAKRTYNFSSGDLHI